jgi:hypothetical protein
MEGLVGLSAPSAREGQLSALEEYVRVVGGSGVDTGTLVGVFFERLPTRWDIIRS